MKKSMPESPSLLARFLRDDFGFVVSSELILLAVIVVIGSIAGLSTLRTAVVFELADIATAIDDLNQSFSFCGVTTSSGTINGSVFIDNTDFCTPAFNDDDPPVQTSSGCIGVLVPATPE